MFVTPAQVRAYLGTEADSGKWVDANVQSLIDSAIAYLALRTGRQFVRQTDIAKEFSTNGLASLTIPDLVSATEVAQDGSVLTAKSSYWLLPDSRQSGIYTGIQLRPYTAAGDGPWYLGRSDWFDRGLDMPNPHGHGSVPNDLVVTGTWGYGDAGPDLEPFLPDEARFAITVLAAWYVLRPDSVLGDASVTVEGAIRTYTALPIEVRAFIEEWQLGQQAVMV